MSIVAAVTDGERAWIGSDTLTTGGVEVGFKGIRWPGGALGITGDFFTLQALLQWLGGKTPPSDPVELALYLRGIAVRRKMGSWSEGLLTLEMAALYVRPDSVWHLASDFTMVRCKSHSAQAVGSGNEVAQGAVWGAQRAGKQFKTVRAALKFGIEAAIAGRVGCGGDVVIHRVR